MEELVKRIDRELIKGNAWDNLLRSIEDYDRIIVHGHQRPDADSVGSRLGFAGILGNIYSDKEIYSPGEIPENLRFMGEGYQIDPALYDGSLVIVCDTHNEDRIDGEHAMEGETIVNMDHHEGNSKFGDINLIDPRSSSTAELIFYTMRGNGLDKETAELLFTGIAGDTGRFRYSNTTERTMNAASKLMRYDIDFMKIYDELEKKSLDLAHFEGHLLKELDVSPNGVGHVFVTQEDLNRFGVSPDEAASLVDIFRDVEGTRAWALMIEYKDGIRTRLRSKGVPVNEVAKIFGGGGHPEAAGASLEGERVIGHLLDELEQTCRYGDDA